MMVKTDVATGQQQGKSSPIKLFLTMIFQSSELCCVNFESETKAHEIVEQIIDQHFLDLCIEATNAHGENDANYMSRVGILTQDEKGRAFMKGFLSIKWHLSLVKYPSKKWAWSDDPLKVQHEIMLLLTNCEVHTGKYLDRSFEVRTERSEVRKKS